LPAAAFDTAVCRVPNAYLYSLVLLKFVAEFEHWITSTFSLHKAHWCSHRHF